MPVNERSARLRTRDATQRQTHAARQRMQCKLYQFIHPMRRAARPAQQPTGDSKRERKRQRAIGKT
eukprot:7554009-Alexandrium_andersonii.AAC.1